MTSPDAGIVLLAHAFWAQDPKAVDTESDRVRYNHCMIAEQADRRTDLVGPWQGIGVHIDLRIQPEDKLYTSS
jgi:hypothetical protein